MGLSNSAELLAMALQFAGEDGGGNSPLQSDALDLMNQAYLNILKGPSEYDLDYGECFPWAKEETPLSLILLPPYEAGTVAMVEDSAGGSFSVAPSVSMVDRVLKCENSDDYYIITAHTAGMTPFTVNAAFTGSDGSYSFKAMKLIYDLGSSVLRISEPIRHYRRPSLTTDEQMISRIDLNIFKTHYPWASIQQGIPSRFAVWKQSDTVFKVIFNRYVDEKVKLDVDWIAYPTALLDDAGSTPIIRVEDRMALVYMTAAYLYNMKKGDENSHAKYISLAKRYIDSMVGKKIIEEEKGSSYFGQLTPRMDQIAGRIKNGY